MTPTPSASFISAISLLDTLVRAGMRHVVVSPGSRSAPLAYAIAALSEAGVLEAHVRIDERTAAFTALGLAKATGAPVGIVTTSGTAVGQCIPALMEASHSGVPLVLISADRPERLRGTGANQTTRQAGLAPAHTRASISLENYSADPADPQTGYLNLALAAVTGRSPQNWNEPATEPVGPVHINLAFDIPLTPGEADSALLARWARSLTDQPPAKPAPLAPADPAAPAWLRSQNLPAQPRRTVVVAGDGAGPIAADFAQKLGLPLLAEPSSNARFSTAAIEAYRQVLLGELGNRIERVVVFGHPTLSRPVSNLLARTEVEGALYEPAPAPWHEPGRSGLRPVSLLAELADFAGIGADGWLSSWIEQAKQAAEQLHAAVGDYRQGNRPARLSGADDRTAGLSLALDAWEQSLADDSVLVVGSSTLIRDLDLIIPVAPASPLIFANRGLAGIDGTLATAAGISLGLNRRVRVLVGDLTFLHDSGSLNIGPAERKPNLEVLVYDDRGGGIFATLEHGHLAGTEQFGAAVTRFFTTPHTAHLEALAQAWGDNGITVRVVTP